MQFCYSAWEEWKISMFFGRLLQETNVLFIGEKNRIVLCVYTYNTWIWNVGWFLKLNEGTDVNFNLKIKLSYYISCLYCIIVIFIMTFLYATQ